jgi:hypothetical protein
MKSKENVSLLTIVDMKKIAKMLFSLVLCAMFIKPSTSTFALTEFAGGDGTATNPYLIENAEQFSAIRANLSAHYALIDDIDLSTLIGSVESLDPLYNNGEGWIPIGTYSDPFIGVLDGRGFTICGLAIKKTPASDETFMGLFGVVEDALFYNFDLEGEFDSTKTLHTRAGLLAYSMTGGLVSGVKVSGRIMTTSLEYDLIGGLVGETMHASIYNTESHVLLTVNSEGNTGGFIGYADQTNIHNVIFRGDIHSSRGHDVGGIVGYMVHSGIYYAQNFGFVSGYDRVGGIVGTSEISDVVAAVNYASIETQTYHGGGIVGVADFEAESNSVTHLSLSLLINFGSVSSNLLDPDVRLGGIIGLMDFLIGVENDVLEISHWIDFGNELPLVSTIIDRGNVYPFEINFFGIRATNNEYLLDKYSPLKGLITVVDNTETLDLNIIQDIVDGINSLHFDVEASIENTNIVIDFAHNYYLTQGKLEAALDNDVLFANTIFLRVLPSLGFSLPMIEDFSDISWDMTGIIGFNTKLDDSGTLYEYGDTLVHVRGVAFVRIFATDVNPTEDDNDDDVGGEDDEELPPTSDPMSWSWLALLLGLASITCSKKKS